jgi:hypothetical protein
MVAVLAGDLVSAWTKGFSAFEVSSLLPVGKLHAVSSVNKNRTEKRQTNNLIMTASSKTTESVPIFFREKENKPG